MSRQVARDTLFKIVYGFIINREFDEFTFDNLTDGYSFEDKDYIYGCINGIMSEEDILRKKITMFSQNFSFDRIYKVDLACLYIGIYEILFRGDIPDKVSANEATELAKIYSSEKSYSFVNGILASVIKEKNGGFL